MSEEGREVGRRFSGGGWHATPAPLTRSAGHQDQNTTSRSQVSTGRCAENLERSSLEGSDTCGQNVISECEGDTSWPQALVCLDSYSQQLCTSCPKELCTTTPGKELTGAPLCGSTQPVGGTCLVGGQLIGKPVTCRGESSAKRKKGGRDLILDDDKGPKGSLEVTAKVDIKCNIRMLSLNGKRYIRLRACL